MTAPAWPGYPTAPQPVYPQAPMPAGQFYGQPAPLPPGIQPQPHWQQGGQAPQQQPVPQYQQPQQQAQPQQLDHIRIPQNDPSWPPELWGRTIGEAKRYYGIMRQDFVARRQQEQNQPPLQGQPQQQGQHQQQQPWQQQQQQQQPDPVQRTVEAAVNAALDQRLQPVNENLALNTYQRVRQQFPDWQNYDAEIQASLQGSPPAMLADPRTWEMAYDLIRGRRLRALPPGGGQQQPQFQQSGPGGFQAPGPGYPPGPGGYGAPAPQYAPPAPQAYNPGSFTEAPTPPAPVPGYGQGQADPRDEMFARRFGMSVEQYRAAKADPDAAARYALSQRENGRSGQVQIAPPQGYGYPQGMMPPAYPPQPYPPQAPQPYGQPFPQAYNPFGYAGMSTPNGGYYGR